MMDAIAAATALKLIFGATIACSAPPGTIVASLLPKRWGWYSGGVQHNRQWRRIRPRHQRVSSRSGPLRDRRGHCGSTSNVTVTASQK
jgi:hypothetical protein